MALSVFSVVLFFLFTIGHGSPFPASHGSKPSHIRHHRHQHRHQPKSGAEVDVEAIKEKLKPAEEIKDDDFLLKKQSAIEGQLPQERSPLEASSLVTPDPRLTPAPTPRSVLTTGLTPRLTLTPSPVRPSISSLKPGSTLKPALAPEPENHMKQVPHPEQTTSDPSNQRAAPPIGDSASKQGQLGVGEQRLNNSEKRPQSQGGSEKRQSQDDALSQEAREKTMGRVEPADIADQEDRTAAESKSRGQKTRAKAQPVGFLPPVPKAKQERRYVIARIRPANKKLINRPSWQRLRESEASISGQKKGRKIKQSLKNGNITSSKHVHHAGKPIPAKSPRRSWSLNRPEWGSSKKASSSDSDAGISSKHSRKSSAKVEKSKKPIESDKAANQKKAAKRKGSNKKSAWRSMKKKKPVAKGCPGCSKTELAIFQARELHKQVLKRQLLDKLRLVPTFKKRPWPPKLPEQVLPDSPQRDHAGYDDQYYAKPTQLLILGHDLGPRHGLRKSRTGVYQFEVTDKVKGEVTSANLWVYKMKDARDIHGQTLVVTELHFDKRGHLRERSLVARMDTNVQEGWLNFDITRLVQRWVEKATPASLQMLAIRCKTCHRTYYRAIFGIKSNFRPVLVVAEDRDGRRQKNKRSACDPTVRCCKFDLRVSFEELGIYEIFRPRTIDADYCYGSCEGPTSYHYNHTMVTQHMRYNSQYGNETMRERLKPCCVPVVLREASILHYLNDGLDTQISLVPNLLVERCGCA